MEYRKFGQTDLTVSVFGFGVYRNAGDYGAQIDAAVHRAIDLGITCFDTAPNYGEGDSERVLGRALGPRRKDVVVVTKCGYGYENRPQGRDSRRESILALVDQSLQRLRTDYVDVLLVHLADVTTPFEETMGALDSVVQQGKARAVGVGNFTLDQLKECEATRPIDVVYYPLNMFDRRKEQEIFPYCQQQGIGMMVWASMGFGLLTGTFTEDMKFEDWDWRGWGGYPEFDGGIFVKEHLNRHVRLVDELKPIAERRGKTMPQLALRWVLSNPTVSVALVGTPNVQELEENWGVLDWALSGEDLRQIDEVFARHGVDTHPNIRELSATGGSGLSPSRSRIVP